MLINTHPRPRGPIPIILLLLILPRRLTNRRQPRHGIIPLPAVIHILKIHPRLHNRGTAVGPPPCCCVRAGKRHGRDGFASSSRCVVRPMIPLGVPRGWDRSPIHRHVPPTTRRNKTRRLQTHVVHLPHELDGKTVVACETEELVLVVALVEKDDVHGDRGNLVNGLNFRDNPRGIITLVLEAKFQHSGLELLDLGFCRAEAELEIDRVGETLTAALVEDEEVVEQRVGRLHDMTFHFLELGVEKGDLDDVVVITSHHGAGIAVDGDAVTDVEGVFDKDEDDGLESVSIHGILNDCG